MANDDANHSVYKYNPSVAAACILAVMFGLITIAHMLKMFRSRAWFLIPLVVGGLFEVIGYGTRAFSASQTPNWSRGPYIIQTVLILVAPAVFAASIYMILGRIILMTDGESHSIIKKKLLTKIFVTGDVVSFLVQGMGGGQMASKKSSAADMGQKIVVAGLFIQIISFGFFIVVSVIFHRRMNKFPTGRVLNNSPPWKKHLHALYIASALVMIRSAFRVVEFIQGRNGSLLSHEWFSYVFDSVLMVGVLGLFLWVHPGEIKEYLGEGKSRNTESPVPLRRR